MTGYFHTSCLKLMHTFVGTTLASEGFFNK
jgi:hypothetical protein